MEGCIQNLKIHTEDAKLKFSRYSGLPHSVIHITHFFLSRCGLGKGMIPHSASLGIPTVRFTCNPEFFCRVFEGSCPPNKPDGNLLMEAPQEVMDWGSRPCLISCNTGLLPPGVCYSFLHIPRRGHN